MENEPYKPFTAMHFGAPFENKMVVVKWVKDTLVALQTVFWEWLFPRNKKRKHKRTGQQADHKVTS